MEGMEQKELVKRLWEICLGFNPTTCPNPVSLVIPTMTNELASMSDNIKNLLWYDMASAEG